MRTGGRRTVGHTNPNRHLCAEVVMPILGNILAKRCVRMETANPWAHWLRAALIVMIAATLDFPSLPAVKNLAVVVSAGSKRQDVPLAELTKMCKGAQKTWPDGRNFTPIMKDPGSPDMHVAVQKLCGAGGADAKTAIAKLN